MNKKSLNLAFFNLRNHCMALLSVRCACMCVCSHQLERELVEERSARTGDVRLTSSHRLWCSLSARACAGERPKSPSLMTPLVPFFSSQCGAAKAPDLIQQGVKVQTYTLIRMTQQLIPEIARKAA